MASWKKFCPDYVIIEWNEENFDFASNLYASQAYDVNKWAFVSDYARLYLLYHHGGIYMDTDIELLTPLDAFLENKAFSGFESEKSIQTGIMGCEKGHPFFKTLLNYYDQRVFIKENKAFDYTTNVKMITDYCLTLGLIFNNTKQTVADVTFYSSDFFLLKIG
jgi:mannosyltransferase OCH1-like enzyme